jgi:glycosyltransferase involved in cell wall biosynthesis
MISNLSANILVRNENNYFFEASLNKLSLFCDEIVVIIDKRTTDKTEELLAKYPKVRPYYFDWVDEKSYTDAKNFGIDKCTSDWILELDADEVITDNYKIILEELKNPFHNCYSLISEHFIYHLAFRDATFTPHIHSFRLHRKNIKYTPEHTMHGTPMPPDGKFGILGDINNPIIFHYGYCKNILGNIKRYRENKKHKELHSEGHLEWWLNAHTLGTYPVQIYNYNNHPKEIKELFR